MLSQKFIILIGERRKNMQTMINYLKKLIIKENKQLFNELKKMDSQVHIDLSHLMQLLEKQLNEDGPGMLLTCQDIFAAYIKVTNYDIRKERIKWLISMLATDEMKNNDQFY